MVSGGTTFIQGTQISRETGTIVLNHKLSVGRDEERALSSHVLAQSCGIQDFLVGDGGYQNFVNVFDDASMWVDLPS